MRGVVNSEWLVNITESNNVCEWNLLMCESEMGVRMLTLSMYMEVFRKGVGEKVGV